MKTGHFRGTRPTSYIIMYNTYIKKKTKKKKQNMRRIRADLFMCACVYVFIVSVGQNVGVLSHSTQIIISSMTTIRYIRVFYSIKMFFFPLQLVDFFLVTL